MFTGKVSHSGYGYIETAIDYIKSHLSEQITLDEVAKELLIYSDKSVLDVSMECGFGSFSAFSRTFKSICKCGPTEFKSKAIL